MGWTTSHTKLLENSKKIFSDWLIAADEFASGGSYIDFAVALVKVRSGFRDNFNVTLPTDDRFGIVGYSRIAEEFDRDIGPLQIGLGTATVAVRLLSSQFSDADSKAQVEKILQNSLGSVRHRSIRTTTEYKQLKNKEGYIRGCFNDQMSRAAHRIIDVITLHFEDLKFLDKQSEWDLRKKIDESLNKRRRAAIKNLAK